MRYFRRIGLGTVLLVTTAATAGDAIDIGLVVPLDARVVVDGLSNPSCVTFRPDGTLTVCDSGNGRVVLVKDGQVTDYITGFKTEYWKVDAETGKQSFKLGPLSAVWVDQDTLAVTNAGLGDGAETVLFFDGAGTVDSGRATNSVGPTTDDAKDKGEGNLTGLSLSSDGSTIYVAGQGADAATWILTADVASGKLSPVLSADRAGIEVNSPMATIAEKDGSLLVLYSGTGGKDDGLIVQWDVGKKEVIRKWTLPGLTDPMGMVRIPFNDRIVVVDNNWSLTEVTEGRVAIVDLNADSSEANVRIIADGLRGPVSCALSPDGKLYIAQLGEAFDSDKGQVIVISRP